VSQHHKNIFSIASIKLKWQNKNLTKFHSTSLSFGPSMVRFVSQSYPAITSPKVRNTYDWFSAGKITTFSWPRKGTTKNTKISNPRKPRKRTATVQRATFCPFSTRDGGSSPPWGARGKDDCLNLCYFFFFFPSIFFFSVARRRSTFFTSSAGGRFSGTMPRLVSILRTAALLSTCSLVMAA